MLDIYHNPIHPFKKFENSETTVVRAIEAVKIIFKNFLTDIEMGAIVNDLSLMSNLTIDTVALLFLNRFRDINYNKIKLYKDIFYAVSTNQD